MKIQLACECIKLVAQVLSGKTAAQTITSDLLEWRDGMATSNYAGELTEETDRLQILKSCLKNKPMSQGASKTTIKKQSLVL